MACSREPAGSHREQENACNETLIDAHSKSEREYVCGFAFYSFTLQILNVFSCLWNRDGLYTGLTLKFIITTLQFPRGL